MKNILGVLITLFFSGFLFANAQNQDSIVTEKILEEALTNVYKEPTQSKKTITVNLANYQLSPYFVSKSLNYIGIAYDVMGKNDSALSFYDSALVIAKNHSFEGLIAGIQNNIGLISWKKGNYDEAIKHYDTALSLYRKIDKKEGIASTLNNMGLIYQKMAQYDKSSSAYKQAYSNYLAADNKRGASAVLMNIGAIMDLSGKRDSSFYYFRKAISLKKEINDTYGLGLAYADIAKPFQKENLCDSAVIYNRKALKIFTELKNNHHIAQVNYGIGKDFMCLAILDSAEFYFKKAEELALISENYFTLKNINLRLVELYKLNQSWEKAFAASQEVIKYKDSLYSKDKAKAIFDVQEKYETEKKDKEIALQDAELAEAKLENSKKNFLLLVSAISLLGFIILVISVFQNAKSKREKLIQEKELKVKEEKLRISRDLHDHIGAELTLIKSRIDKRAYLTKDKEEKTELTEISNYTKEAIDQLRKVIWATKNEYISLENFIENLAGYINRFEIESTVKNNHPNIDFNATIALNLFRVCQEIINNAVKYSEGEKIEIEFNKTENDALLLAIHDNGKGFDINETEEGNGIANIKYRIKEIGGTIDLLSNENGTSYHIKLNPEA